MAIPEQAPRSWRSMQIEIGGRTLTVKSDAPEARVNAVVALVNERLEALQAQTGAVSTDHLGLMVALTMAEDLFTLQERHQTLKAHVQDRSHRLLETLDQLSEEPLVTVDEG